MTGIWALEVCDIVVHRSAHGYVCRFICMYVCTDYVCMYGLCMYGVCTYGTSGMAWADSTSLKQYVCTPYN